MSVPEGWLRDEQINELYERNVRPLLFEGIAPSERPVVVFVGAQPGAGKSRTVDAVRRQLGTHSVAISGDEFRQFHPLYARLRRENPVAMPNATQHFSGPAVGRAIEDARARRVNVVIEGTCRDPDTTFATMRRFADGGYRTRLVVVSTPLAQSQLAAVQRYLNAVAADVEARWTPIGAMSTGYEESAQILASARTVPWCHEISVYDRDGDVIAFDARGAEPEGAWATATRLDHACRESRIANAPSPEQYAAELADGERIARELGQDGAEFASAYALLRDRLAELRGDAASR